MGGMCGYQNFFNISEWRWLQVHTGFTYSYSCYPGYISRSKNYGWMLPLEAFSFGMCSERCFNRWHLFRMVQQLFGGKTTLQPPNPLLTSSLKLDQHISMATPAPFLTIEYSASNSEESLSISFTKATFINWSPETIAAIQLALKPLCHQTERAFFNEPNIQRIWKWNDAFNFS